MSLQSVMKAAGVSFENRALEIQRSAIDAYFRDLAAQPRPTRKAVLLGIAKMRTFQADMEAYWANASALVAKSGDSDARHTVRRAIEICKRHQTLIDGLMKQFDVAAHQCARCGQDTDEATAQCPGCNAKMDNHVHENLRQAAAAEPTQDFDLNRERTAKRIERSKGTRFTS